MDSMLEHLKTQTQALIAAQSPPPPPAATPPSTSADVGTHVSQEVLAQFLQQAKDCIHTGLAASTSTDSKADTKDLWKNMESLFYQFVIPPTPTNTSQPSQPSHSSVQPPTPLVQPGGDAAASQPSTAHKRESPLDGSTHPDSAPPKITKP
eukprot:12424927-Karenia_brevis.AAC.1